jgi:hypothetical protein
MIPHFHTRSPRKLRLERFEDRRTPAALFAEDFSDNAAGWTLGNRWGIAPASSGSGLQGYGFADPTTDSSPTSDNGVAGVVIGGNFPIFELTPMQYLTSPVINTAGQASATLDYQRWLNVFDPVRTPHTVDVFDGTAWRNVYTAGPTAESVWNRVAHDLTPYRNSNMRVRFGFGVVDTNSSFLVSGWNVDDVTVGRLPVAAPDTILANRTGVRTFPAADLLTNDTDADGDALTVVSVGPTTVAGGAVFLSNGTISYFPPTGGLNGVDTFFYTVREPSGLTVTAKVTVQENKPPVANQDEVLAEPTGARIISAAGLVANDQDPDGGAVHVTAVSPRSQAGGSVLFDGKTIVYIPAKNSPELDHFEYTVADPLGLTAKSEVRVRVNAAPVVGPDAYTVPEDGKLVVPVSAGLLANDTDAENDPVHVSIVASPTHGTLVSKGNGAFDYTPQPEFHGTDSFVYAVTDDFHTVTGTVKLFVTSVVDTPSVPLLDPASDTGASATDGITSARALGLSGTAEADARVTVWADGAVLGTTTADPTGAWTYTTPALAVGPRSLTVTAADAAGNVGPESAPLNVAIIGAPTARIATAAASGPGPATVAVFDPAGTRLFDLAPGWPTANGTRLATGDITGDGVADVAVTPKTGPALGTVIAYDGATGGELFRQAPIGHGARTAIALGDVNGDGHADLVAAGLSGPAAGRIVAVSGKSNLPLFHWGRAAGTTVHGVQSGDVNGDLLADVWVHQTQKGFGTDVVAYSAADRTEGRRFDGKPMKLAATDRFGVGDVSGDGLADLIVGTAAGKVVATDGADGKTQLGSFAAVGGGKGARGVAAADVTGDGVMEILVGAAKSGRSDGLVRVTDLAGLTVAGLLLASFGPNFKGGIEV